MKAKKKNGRTAEKERIIFILPKRLIRGLEKKRLQRLGQGRTLRESSKSALTTEALERFIEGGR